MNCAKSHERLASDEQDLRLEQANGKCGRDEVFTFSGHFMMNVLRTVPCNLGNARYI